MMPLFSQNTFMLEFLLKAAFCPFFSLNVDEVSLGEEVRGLLLRRNKLVDVSAALQLLLHGDEQFDAIHHQLGQTHLAHTEGRHVAHLKQCRGFWEMKDKVELHSSTC